jgi:hypothetical protein
VIEYPGPPVGTPANNRWPAAAALRAASVPTGLAACSVPSAWVVRRPSLLLVPELLGQFGHLGTLYAMARKGPVD